MRNYWYAYCICWGYWAEMNGARSFSNCEENGGVRAMVYVVGWAMKDYKQICFSGEDSQKTPMQVLHSLLPALQITGFKSAQTAIFEDDCQAVIDYKSTQHPSLFARLLNKKIIDMQLTISVSKSCNDNCSFDIYSELIKA